MEATVRSSDVSKDSSDVKAQVLQQRLLLLNHSSKCTIAEDQVCPVIRESAKRESTDSSSSPNASCKKPRSSYWWASETFVQFTKAVTVNTNDFVSPSPAKFRSQSHSSFGSSSHSPYSTAQPLSVEKLNHNMHQMTIGGPPPRRPEVP
eukprot:gene13393-15421_t